MNTTTANAQAIIDEGLRAHMSKVYGLMSVALMITFFSAYLLSGMAEAPSIEGAAVVLENGVPLTDFGAGLYTSGWSLLVMLLPLVLVFAAPFVTFGASAFTAQVFFYLFALAMGASLSSVFIVYTSSSIVQVFLITSIAFASLSIYGYTTKKDLDGLGNFMIMGLIGLIGVMIVNIFLRSPAIDFAISAAGVLIFAGLTAYDTQKTKDSYLQNRGNHELLGKLAIMSALELYLDFINLMIHLLKLMGQKR